MSFGPWKNLIPSIEISKKILFFIRYWSLYMFFQILCIAIKKKDEEDLSWSNNIWVNGEFIRSPLRKTRPLKRMQCSFGGCNFDCNPCSVWNAYTTSTSKLYTTHWLCPEHILDMQQLEFLLRCVQNDLIPQGVDARTKRINWRRVEEVDWKCHTFISWVYYDNHFGHWCLHCRRVFEWTFKKICNSFHFIWAFVLNSIHFWSYCIWLLMLVSCAFWSLKLVSLWRCMPPNLFV